MPPVQSKLLSRSNVFPDNSIRYGLAGEATVTLPRNVSRNEMKIQLVRRVAATLGCAAGFDHVGDNRRSLRCNGGVPANVLADRMGCPKGEVVSVAGVRSDPVMAGEADEFAVGTRHWPPPERIANSRKGFARRLSIADPLSPAAEWGLFPASHGNFYLASDTAGSGDTSAMS